MNAIADEINNLALLFSDRKIKLKDSKEKVRLFIDAFSNFSDYRFKPYTKYKFENLIGICFVMALMGKFTSFYNVEQYVKLKPSLFIKLGLVEKGKYPSNDTYSRAFQHLDNKEFIQETIGRIRQFYEKVQKYSKPKGRRMISGDGQVVKGTNITSSIEDNSCRAINILNFYDVSKGVVLCSKQVKDKTNEIPLFQSLLKKFDINNAIITADALHCQKETVKIISDRKADYCIAAKSNQPSLVEMIDKIFSLRNPDKELNYSDRDYKIIKLKTGEITPEWENAKCIVKTISHKREAREKKAGEVMNFLTSLSDYDEIVQAIDMRWKIENDLHRFKDIQLSQDKIRVREKTALRNMVSMNNVVYSLYRVAASIMKKTPQQVKIIYEDDPIGMLTKICPLMVGNNFTMLVKKNMRGTSESKK